jgi:serine/threonine protein kinase
MRSAPTTDEPSLFVGLRLENAGPPTRGYQIEGFLGAGTQALVFAARTDHGAPVALKLLRPSLVRGHGPLAELLAQKEWIGLCHVPPSPYLVRAFDVGRLAHGGLLIPWLVLERLSAVPLATVVARTRSETGFGLPPARALLLLGQAAEGLRVLHDAGIVHRDVKPSNVLVSGAPPHEVARIADLGVSRAPGLAPTFGVGARLGSPDYAAPEIGSADPGGPAADIFSLGATAYFALAGEPMFAGSMPVIAALKAREAHTPLAGRASVHPSFAASGTLPALSAVLDQAVRRDPRARPGSAGAFWAAAGGLIARALSFEHGRVSALPAARDRTTREFRLDDDDEEGR